MLENWLRQLNVSTSVIKNVTAGGDSVKMNQHSQACTAFIFARSGDGDVLMYARRVPHLGRGARFHPDWIRSAAS